MIKMENLQVGSYNVKIKRNTSLISMETMFLLMTRMIMSLINGRLHNKIPLRDL